jgi:hypothetical protein
MNPMCRTRIALMLVVTAVLCAAGNGCLLLAGGAAAGGAAGYAYYRGNVTEKIDGDFTTVWHATQDALYDLGMPIKKVSRDTLSGVIESQTGNGERVKISIEQIIPKIPTDPPQTEVGVRIATFGDQETSRRILQQIAFRTHAQAVNQPSGAAAAGNWRIPPQSVPGPSASAP